MNDALLVARTLSGDKGAFAVIVEKYKNIVFGVCLKMLRHYEDAEDVAQEVFLSAYQNMPKLAEPEKLSAWLKQIAKYKSLNELRRRAAKGETEEIPETFADEGKTPAESLVLAEDTAKLITGLTKLPEHLRVTVSLRYLHGLSTAETAKKLGIPEGTVKSRLHLGIEKLRKEVFGMTQIREERKEVGTAFTEKVMTMVDSLRRYTRTDSFDGKYKTVMDMIDRLPDSKEKNEARAEALMYRSWSQTLSDEDAAFVKTYRSADHIIDDYTGKYVKEGKEEVFEEGMKKAKELGLVRGEARLRFWHGRKLLQKKEVDAALLEFETAKSMLPESDAFYANSIAAIAVAKKMRDLSLSEGKNSYISACGEMLTKVDDKLYFISQPGFSEGGCDQARFDSIFFFASNVGDLFYKESLAVGESICDKKGNILTCISRDKTVETPAGTFEGCVEFFSDIKDCYSFVYTAETVYKEGVGLIRLHVRDRQWEETYELSEYEVKGGTGLLPFAVGNRYRYQNMMLPSYITEEIERECVFFDEDYAGFTSWEFITYDENIENYADADAYSYIERADSICDSMKRTDPYDEEKVEKARRDFRRAMQIAVKPRDAILAEAGLDFLEKRARYMKNGWRLLPSSVSLYSMTHDDDKYQATMEYRISPFYGLGARSLDNKIWGMKLFWYLEECCGTIFDSRWLSVLENDEVFTEVKNEGNTDEEIRITAKKGGTIVTKAGIFRNCIAVTLEKGRQDGDYRYYWNNNEGHYRRGRKTFYFAPDVGIVKMDCRWGDTRCSSLELASYKSVSTSGEYLPFYYGMEWHYEEVTFLEKYIAEIHLRIAGGTPNQLLAVYEQNVCYMASEEEYKEAAKLSPWKL